jgi:hypothetical protein
LLMKHMNVAKMSAKSQQAKHCQSLAVLIGCLHVRAEFSHCQIDPALGTLLRHFQQRRRRRRRRQRSIFLVISLFVLRFTSAMFP